MKMYKYIAAAGVLALMTSCGVSNRHEECVALEGDNEEWTADQTNKAIDIYIEGLNEFADLYKKVYLIDQKIGLEYQIEQKGKRSVRKERKDEMKEAEKALKEKDKEIKKKYREDED